MPSTGYRFRSRPWHAALYDRLCGANERSPLAALRADLLGSLAGEVLEIGAGTGANLRHYPRHIRLTCAEPDPAMLARARSRLAPSRGGPPALILATAESLPVASGSVDAVVSTLVLCTVTDPVRALEEVARVLRPGGRLLFIEHVRATGWPGRVQDVVRPAWAWFAGGCTLNRHTEAAIAGAGFRFVHLSRRPLGRLPVISGVATLDAPRRAAPGPA